MPQLNKIVDQINEGWKDAIFSCEPLCDCSHNFKGLAETILDTQQGEQSILVSYPGIIDEAGEVEMVQVNDKVDFLVYHKLENIANNVLPGKGFGNETGELQEITTLAALVIAWRSKIKMAAHDLEMLLKDNLPNDPIKLNGQKSKIFAGISTFDKITLLQREYTRIEINYPDLIFFEMRYRIETSYKKNCVPVCN